MEYRCQTNLNLYKSPDCDGLVTQAAAGRHLRILATEATAIAVCLCEDDYSGWLPLSDRPQLVPTSPYQPIAVAEPEIRARVLQVIAFAQAAQAQPNTYLWGGTVAPNYDCSGLMQAAFAAAGIWIPRDAYQQEAFVQSIALADLTPGDLVFFGTPVKATHVGLYLGDDQYIHSSGRDQGRNGIGVDRVTGAGDRVTQTYQAQIRGAGRVVACYQPSGTQPS
jgi:cell wall-associated NlpC family hydrolase